MASIEDILAQIKAGGPARAKGVSGLYEQYSSRFLGFYLRNHIERQYAEELVQDAFVNIVRACGEFRGECPLEAWLWRIARNTMLDYLRQRKPEQSLDDEDAGLGAENISALRIEPAHAGLQDCVARAFEDFAAKYPQRAESLTLFTIEGWTMREIAGFLQRTEGASREYLSQCRKLLRPFLERCRDYLTGT